VHTNIDAISPPADMNSPDDDESVGSGMKRKRRSSTVQASGELTGLRDEIKRVREENEKLREENEKLREENEKLREENEKLREENEKLRAEMQQQSQHSLAMIAELQDALRHGINPHPLGAPPAQMI
jgi:predicted RNase H-like nuclease (RuvC/YqgF family)